MSTRRSSGQGPQGEGQQGQGGGACRRGTPPGHLPGSRGAAKEAGKAEEDQLEVMFKCVDFIGSQGEVLATF